jgi:transposase InsO family protein
MAIESTGKSMLEGLIHHSDRGVQYCCDEYVNLLKDYSISISMTEDYNPTDNAIAERINGTLKTEVIYREQRFTGFADAERRIASFIGFYNDRRPHSSIGMKVPSQVHQESGEQQRCW